MTQQKTDKRKARCTSVSLCVCEPVTVLATFFLSLVAFHPSEIPCSPEMCEGCWRRLVKWQMWKRVNGSEEVRVKETILCSLCLLFHWLILSVQRLYLNSGSALSALRRSIRWNNLQSLFQDLLEISELKRTPRSCSRVCLCGEKIPALLLAVKPGLYWALYRF